MTTSRNTRSYTLQSVPSSFLLYQCLHCCARYVIFYKRRNTALNSSIPFVSVFSSHGPSDCFVFQICRHILRTGTFSIVGEWCQCGDQGSFCRHTPFHIPCKCSTSNLHEPSCVFAELAWKKVFSRTNPFPTLFPQNFFLFKTQWSVGFCMFNLMFH